MSSETKEDLIYLPLAQAQRPGLVLTPNYPTRGNRVILKGLAHGPTHTHSPVIQSGPRALLPGGLQRQLGQETRRQRLLRIERQIKVRGERIGLVCSARLEATPARAHPSQRRCRAVQSEVQEDATNAGGGGPFDAFPQDAGAAVVQDLQFAD